ncbi:hypothetical protein [Streptomyces capitiformicae]|uniref:Uncharacterized protein n=1 Tax=Streptomyces capitiformicae TaxID=2014920 RepID=A0A919DQB6_9ACTN|nr:hypothetical protein [Streptomyces capitiformicae]GHE71136.1 hypothetical protein GCM10017771_95100 [Streptomyces capitiformicae]
MGFGWSGLLGRFLACAAGPAKAPVSNRPSGDADVVESDVVESDVRADRTSIFRS